MNGKQGCNKMSSVYHKSLQNKQMKIIIANMN